MRTASFRGCDRPGITADNRTTRCPRLRCRPGRHRTHGPQRPDAQARVLCAAAVDVNHDDLVHAGSEMIQASGNIGKGACVSVRRIQCLSGLYESSDTRARARLPVPGLVNIRFGRILEMYRRGGRFVRVSISAWPRTRPLFLRWNSGIFLTMCAHIQRIDAWLDDVPIRVHDIHAEFFALAADAAPAQHAFAFAIALPAMCWHDDARQGGPYRLHYCDPCHAVTRCRYRRHCRRGRRHVRLTVKHGGGACARAESGNGQVRFWWLLSQ